MVEWKYSSIITDVLEECTTSILGVNSEEEKLSKK
jgi:hypothetical protein